MIIADFLDFPSQFIHYLRRRTRLNEVAKTYAHDEIDWFGHYLNKGLYFVTVNKSPALRAVVG